MGDPKTIGSEANHQNRPILRTLRNNGNLLLVCFLALILIGMSTTLYLLGNRLVSAEKEIKTLKNDVSSLNFSDSARAKSIDELKLGLIDIRSSIDTLNLYAIPKYAMPGILCCDNEIYRYNSVADTTTITPTHMPLKIIVEGKIPDYVKLVDSPSGFSFTFDKDNQVQFLFGFSIYSKAAVRELRGINGGTFDLGNGFLVVRTMDISWILEGTYDQLANEFLNRKWTITLVK